MAQVDLYGADAQRVRQQYKTSLLRDAGDDEVTGWLSGTYGGGGLNDWLKQIAESNEAQQRGTWKPPQNTPPPGTTVGQNPNVSRPQTTTQTPVYQNTDWWATQGVTPDQIFDQNGQMRPGWSRTGKGYERTGGTTTGQKKWGDPGKDYRGWFLNTVTKGLLPSGRNLESLGPDLAAYGIKLGPRNAAGMIDTIIMPDGSRWDVIKSATMDGGEAWHWEPAGSGSGSSNRPGVGGGQLPGDQYSDQYTRLMEQMIKSRLEMLQGGINDPWRQQYEQAMARRAQALERAEPQYQQLLAYLQKRFGDLQGPGYTGAENEAIRTGALDPIETDRAAAKKRVLDQISARGLTPDSGIAQQMLADVDRAFDGFRSESQTVLTTNDLARRESRQQRAEQLGAQLVDIPEARAREQLDVFGALEELERAMRDEEEARSREAIGYSGALADLGPQRLQLAMAAAGMGGNPQGLFNNLFNMAQLNQNASLLRGRNSSQLWSGLGSIAAMLAAAGRR